MEEDEDELESDIDADAVVSGVVDANGIFNRDRLKNVRIEFLKRLISDGFDVREELDEEEEPDEGDADDTPGRARTRACGKRDEVERVAGEWSEWLQRNGMDCAWRWLA